MTAIGDGRTLRVCDVCGGVDDHPRHVLAGIVADSFEPPSQATLQRVIDNSPDDQMARLVSELTDRSSQDRHMDCCRVVGCPDGICNVQTVGAEDLRGVQLLEHLVERAPGAFGGGTTMVVGLSAVDFANKVLNHMLRATASTAPAGNFAKLHTGDPGSAGTANASSVTTRPAMTFSAASAGACALASTFPAWASWAGTSPETITHFSVWDASSAGTFLYSLALTASRTVQTGDTLTWSSGSVSLAPLAA
jgi:hypothetical protein